MLLSFGICNFITRTSGAQPTSLGFLCFLIGGFDSWRLWKIPEAIVSKL
jgi:hypothetical protein